MYLNKKTIICIVMCIWIVFMAVGFALFSERLTITGTSHVDSNWEIKITNISTSDIVGDATEKTAPSYTDTTARLKVSLINPTDSITYNIKIKNLGTLDARIKKINITEGTSDAIEFEVECKIENGNYETCDEAHFKNQVLAPNAEQTLKIKITFKAGYVGDPSSANKTSTVKVVTDYVQNFEENGVQIIYYDSYSIGDVVEFAGSNWYVIEDSSNLQDYIVLLKQSVLTTVELGTYNAQNSNMSFYWSDSCYGTWSYGHTTDSDSSGCVGHEDYAGSKIKEFLEGTYISGLGSSNLKEVNNYMVRLLTFEDINNNSLRSYSWMKGVGDHWIMGYINSPSAGSIPNHCVCPGLVNGSDIKNYLKVRPVINLLKDAI